MVSSEQRSDLSLRGQPTDPGAAPYDDAGGVESKLRMGRAIKTLLQRDPKPIHVGRYRIIRRIGAGGMSVVYAAWDDELDREVAIKLLRASTASAPNWQRRLRREATAMASLGHVNVAHVYEVGEHDGCPFIAMELIVGTTVRQWLAQRTRSVPEIIAMYVQAARGLAAAHDEGLVHRDFKPDNVLVDQHGWARVLDFGLVLAAGESTAAPPEDESDSAGESADDEPGPTADAATVGHTLPGTVLGTPAYMAPEQMNGTQVVDARADQFALCVALYEALHGERPFPGDSLTEISKSMRRQRVRPVVLVSERVPKAVAEVITRGLEQDPEHRYPSMDTFIDALILAQQQRERARRSELERRAQALDFGPRSELRWRHSMFIGVTLASVVAVLYMLRIAGIHEADYPDAIAIGVLLIVLQRLSEARLSAAGVNAFGQRWARLLTIASTVVIYSMVFCWTLGLDFNLGLAITFLTAGSASMAVIVFVDARLIISSLCLLATAPALAFAPSYRPLWLILGIVGAYTSLALIWGRTAHGQVSLPRPPGE